MPTIVLVVEDDDPCLKALVDKLTREGYKVSQAKNGAEGLALALAEKPDLILLDIIMPRVDGLEMLKQLRADADWGKNVPVMVLSNLSAEDDKIKASIAEYGVKDYLLKADWSLNNVVKKVQEVLA